MSRRLLLQMLMVTLVCLPAAPAWAEVAARIEVPQGTFTVGDPIDLKLIVTHPPGAVFEFPDVAGAFSRAPQKPDAAGSSPEAAGATGAEGVASLMVEEVKPLPGSDGAAGQTVWSARVRVFTPGQRELPPVTVAYRLAEAGDKSEVTTAPVTVTVTSVLAGKDEQAADIKGQWVLPGGWLPWLIGAAVALAVALLIYYLWRRRRRRPEPAPVQQAAPVIVAEPPYDRAMRELAALLASSMLAEGRVKEFHVTLSEIVKRFLGARYEFDALDRTTEELLADLVGRQMPRGLPDEVARFLHAADMVKFAKHRPARVEIDQTVEAARRILEKGRPVPASSEAAA